MYPLIPPPSHSFADNECQQTVVFCFKHISWVTSRVGEKPTVSKISKEKRKRKKSWRLLAQCSLITGAASTTEMSVNVILHDATAQRTVIFILAEVKTPDLI
jgi:hypothetical protein